MTEELRTFDGLNQAENRRLNEVVDAINGELDSHPAARGIAGKPFQYRLPSDVVQHDLMLLHLQEGFSSDRGHVVAKVLYDGNRPEYLQITRHVGA